MRAAHINWLVPFVLLLAGPAAAQHGSLDPCPPSIVNTCFIGYVTGPGSVVVLMRSDENDALLGEDVDVSAAPAGGPPSAPLDLSLNVGAVVMIDGSGDGAISDARLVSVADPLLTALYVALFMTPEGPALEEDEPAPETDGAPPAEGAPAAPRP